MIDMFANYSQLFRAYYFIYIVSPAKETSLICLNLILQPKRYLHTHKSSLRLSTDMSHKYRYSEFSNSYFELESNFSFLLRWELDVTLAINEWKDDA